MFSNTAAQSLDLSLYSEPLSTTPIRPTADFSRVSGSVFAQTIKQFCQEFPGRCDDIELIKDYDQAECWVSNNVEAGFAIKPNFELVNLFSRQAGRGSEAIKFAQNIYQGITINCHTGKLEDFYGRHGFEVIRHEDNWFSTPEHILPQVAYMAWNKG